jgi:hypothetical protein
MPLALEEILPCTRQLALKKEVEALSVLADAPRLAGRIGDY